MIGGNPIIIRALVNRLTLYICETRDRTHHILRQVNVYMTVGPLILCEIAPDLARDCHIWRSRDCLGLWVKVTSTSIVYTAKIDGDKGTPCFNPVRNKG